MEVVTHGTEQEAKLVLLAAAENLKGLYDVNEAQMAQVHARYFHRFGYAGFLEEISRVIKTTPEPTVLFVWLLRVLLPALVRFGTRMERRK